MRANGMTEEEWVEYQHDFKQNVHLLDEQKLLHLLIEAGFDVPMRFYTSLLFGGWMAIKK